MVHIGDKVWVVDDNGEPVFVDSVSAVDERKGEVELGSGRIVPLGSVKPCPAEYRGDLTLELPKRYKSRLMRRFNVKMLRSVESEPLYWIIYEPCPLCGEHKSCNQCKPFVRFAEQGPIVPCMSWMRAVAPAFNGREVMFTPQQVYVRKSTSSKKKFAELVCCWGSMIRWVDDE